MPVPGRPKTSLFDQAGSQRAREDAPLAEALRPRTLNEVLGQDHILGAGAPVRRLVESGRLVSMILWGPAGTGKTTIAHLISQAAGYVEESVSAATSGVKELREAIERARERRALYAQKTTLFVDEVHRFSKSQQDLLLPSTEAGDVVLIGATTENPYFEVNAALLSRSTLWMLKPLGTDDLVSIVRRGADFRGVEIEDDALEALVSSADGDARAILTTLDLAITLSGSAQSTRVALAQVRGARDGRIRHQSTQSHYDQVSAFIKSLRGSDPDAALYWLHSLLDNGESPRFVMRRMLILASEDVGLADPSALTQAAAASVALDVVGMPEARLHLAQCALYLALAPKSNSVTTSSEAAVVAVREHPGEVPAHLRDAHYAGARTEGFGVGYRYSHEGENHWVAQRYVPEGLELDLYRPTTQGAEGRMVARWRQMTESHQEESPPPVE